MLEAGWVESGYCHIRTNVVFFFVIMPSSSEIGGSTNIFTKWMLLFRKK